MISIALYSAIIVLMIAPKIYKAYSVADKEQKKAILTEVAVAAGVFIVFSLLLAIFAPQLSSAIQTAAEHVRASSADSALLQSGGIVEGIVDVDIDGNGR